MTVKGFNFIVIQTLNLKKKILQNLFLFITFKICTTKTSISENPGVGHRIFNYINYISVNMLTIIRKFT